MSCLVEESKELHPHSAAGKPGLISNNESKYVDFKKEIAAYTRPANEFELVSGSNRHR